VGERYNLSLAKEIDGVGESTRLLVFPDILSLPNIPGQDRKKDYGYPYKMIYLTHGDKYVRRQI